MFAGPWFSGVEIELVSCRRAQCAGRRLQPLLFSFDLLIPGNLTSVDLGQKSCFGPPTWPAELPAGCQRVPIGGLWALCWFLYLFQPLLALILVAFLAAALAGLIERGRS